MPINIYNRTWNIKTLSIRAIYLLRQEIVVEFWHTICIATAILCDIAPVTISRTEYHWTLSLYIVHRKVTNAFWHDEQQFNNQSIKMWRPRLVIMAPFIVYNKTRRKLKTKSSVRSYVCESVHSTDSQLRTGKYCSFRKVSYPTGAWKITINSFNEY